jgi:hypothetical protein
MIHLRNASGRCYKQPLRTCYGFGYLALKVDNGACLAVETLCWWAPKTTT